MACFLLLLFHSHSLPLQFLIMVHQSFGNTRGIIWSVSVIRYRMPKNTCMGFSAMGPPFVFLDSLIVHAGKETGPEVYNFRYANCFCRMHTEYLPVNSDHCPHSKITLKCNGCRWGKKNVVLVALKAS